MLGRTKDYTTWLAFLRMRLREANQSPLHKIRGEFGFVSMGATSTTSSFVFVPTFLLRLLHGEIKS
jgi:hypothetical protein